MRWKRIHDFDGCETCRFVKLQLTLQISAVIITWTRLTTVSVQVIVIDTGHVSDVSLTRPRRSTQPTLLSLCTGSNPVDTVTLRIAFTRWLAGCYGRCSVSLTVSNVCVGNHSPTLATWAYTVNIFTYIHTYTHTYIDYAMNHKNKQIYSNREGANGSHRINDHLRVSTIKTAY